jgi:hypothetical protein
MNGDYKMVETKVMSYWDVELKTRKSITPITNYIVEHGGAVTDTFNHEGSGIYLLRARMTLELSEDVKKQKGVFLVEKPPRITGM